MQRVTISLDDSLLAAIDTFMERHGYASRSEALRDLARSGLTQAETEAPAGGDCVGALVYTYDHGVRDLAARLTETQHHRHDLTLSTLHVHLDHDTCLEVAVLQGPTAEVRDFAQTVIAERGVQHGRLVAVPARIARHDHAHGHGHGTPHAHIHPGPGGAR